jgi:chorismate synthase
MSGVWGKNIVISIFGESHGRSIGITMNGIPAGLTLDLKLINKELQRRSPGGKDFSSERNEEDDFEILSGYFNNKTTGSPLCAIIMNRDNKHKDYKDLRYIMRPSHADYTGYIKHKGFNDYRGGGHFSGRLTAPLVLAGAIAKQLLMKKNIFIGSHIKSILNVEDDSFDELNVELELLKELYIKDFPVLDENQGKKMKEIISTAKKESDSVGGIIETAIINLPPGMGEPFFDSIESRLSQMMFSIPAVKAIEFGRGFDITKIKGSQAKDEYIIEKGQIKTLANNNGGILGGISNGMPIIFNIAIKPTPSIGQKQRTIDMGKMQETSLQIQGRHDPCILPRAIPVVEAGAALVILDLLIEKEGKAWMS